MPPEAAGRGRTAHLWLLLPAAALAALWLSWHSLAAVDFLYPVFYDRIGVHEHIEEFAPQNRYKRGFETTTPAERQRLFAAIVDAIHRSGEGLEELAYRDPAGRPLDRLLRPPEAGHLRDVATLLERLLPAGALAMAWVVVHLVLMRRLGWTMPPLRRLLGLSLAAVAAGVALVLLVGPRRVFAWAHDLVFPPDHPWFFYYQDSLMSTFMMAPYLFGAITLVMLPLAVLYYAALLWLAGRTAPQAG
ncbi:DUF1461 domain-containing protein [Thioalkalivibrio sp. XN8]|uniref:DUF1461 domain-containing protein n=1 Tax=Thioalkalivibrio sp. XN8 TaxID=2712863 RepID=UPI0013EDE3E6|nr:DUF1461 domain-containing protein [Thioalkalivibrio sp. XN8]NGP54215.1 DUF1461 domain-containing protein [Thioalkalivibrio sp. XN8]